jgi:hypothetical protein
MGKKLFLFAGIFLGIFLIGFISASTTEYEYQKANDSTYTGSWFYAQTFTVGTVGLNQEFPPTIVSVYIEGSNVTNWTLGIRNTNSSGAPMGGDFCSSTLSGVSSPGWYNFSLVGCPSLNLSSTYALSLVVPISGAWHDYENLDIYLGGRAYRNTSLGGDWETLPSKHDFTFDIYGTPTNSTNSSSTWNPNWNNYLVFNYDMNDSLERVSGLKNLTIFNGNPIFNSTSGKIDLGSFDDPSNSLQIPDNDALDFIP